MKRFRASFLSTDDPALDAELMPLQDREHTFEDIVATCKRYNVRARIFGEQGQVLGEVERGGYDTGKR